jgi:hypothetical protein
MYKWESRIFVSAYRVYPVSIGNIFICIYEVRFITNQTI